ncbi:phage tail tape measure protein [Brevibacillus sp. NRS-1366]|uniref:phage tail tape measure protein n=1 Tax=Brevibacillus sp. NRS-1366 TaxID=3233899 RepID=UPI003D230034
MSNGQHNLSIELTGQLNVGRTISNLNTQTKALEKSAQLKTLNLNAKIDPKVLNELQSQIKQMQSLLGTNKIRIFDEKEIAKFNQGTQKVFHTVQDAVKEYQKFGQVKVDKNFNPLTGKLRDFTLEVKKADGIVEKLKFDLIHVAEGAKLNNLFQLNNIKTTDTTNKVLAQIRQQKEELRTLARELAQVGALSKSQLGDLGKAINLSSTVKDIENAKQKYQQLLNTQKETLKVTSAQQKVNSDQQKARQQEVANNAVLERRLATYKEIAKMKLQDLRSTYGYKVDQSATQSWLNNVNQLNTSMPNLKQKMQDLNTSFRQISSNAKEASKEGASFGQAFGNALPKFGLWMAASSVFYGFFNVLQNGISHVNELNKSMTDLSIVYMKSQSEVAGYGKEMQKIGVEMSITTNELAKGAAELARQGLSQGEVFARMRTITEYAKISNLSFNESVEIMTASINSMGVTAERAADVFSYMGDATATGADEIGKAMQRVGGTAGAIGIEFEKVSSWIAVVSSRTRESAYTIGNSIKSIIARVQSLKENGFDSEDGTKVNQVAKALAEVGIQLVDSEGNFRNFGTVMDELGGKWDTLSNRQKAYVATTVAGSYQQARFLNLMEGYGETVELYKESLDSAGIAHEKFELYQEGTAAKVDKLKASVEGLYQTFLESSAINGAVTLLTNLSEAMNRATDDSNSLSSAIFSAFSTLPYVQSSKMGIDFLKDFGDEAAFEKRIQNQADTILKTYSTNLEELEKLSERYKELSKNKDNLNVNQEKEYLDVQTKLAKLVPILIDSYDQKGQVVLKSSDALEEELKLAKEIYETEKERRAQNASDDYAQKLQKIAEQQTRINELKQQVKDSKKNGDLELKLKLDFQVGEAQTELNKLKSELGSNVKDLQNIQREVSGIKLGDEYKKIVDDVISSIDFSGMNFAEQQAKFDQLNTYIKTLQNFNEDKSIGSEEKAKAFKSIETGIKQLLAEFGRTPEETQKFINALHQIDAATNKAVNPLAELTSAQAGLQKSFEETAKQVEPLNVLLQEVAEGKSLSASEAYELIQKEAELAKAISVENGVVKINTDLVRKLRDEKIAAHEKGLQLQQQELQNMQSALISKLTMYGVEIKQLDDLNTARQKLATGLQNAKSYGEAVALGSAIGQVNDLQSALDENKRNIEFAKAALKDVGVKSKSGSKTKSEYTPITEEAKKLIQAENELARIRQEQSKWTENSVQYRQSLADERKELEKIITLKQQELATVEKTQRIGGKSNKVGGSTKDSDESFKRAEDLRKEIANLKGDLEEVFSKSEKSTIAGFAKDLQEIDNALEENKDTLESLNSASKEYRDGLETDISLNEAKKFTIQEQIAYHEDLVKQYGLNSSKGREYNNALQQMKDALRGVNKELSDKKLAKFNSQIEEQQNKIEFLNDELQRSKDRMDSMAEGSKAWEGELSNQNGILREQMAINEAMISQTKQKMASLPKESKDYKDLSNQLRNLQAAQIGYNNALRENQALRVQRINEQWDKDVAKEVKRAQELRDEILDSLKKLVNTKDIEFDSTSIKTKITSALNNLKNLNGEFVIDPKIKSIDSFEELEKLINKYTKNLETVNKETEDLFKQGGTKSDLANAIRDEAKYASTIKKDIKETNKLLEQKRLQYDQIEKSLEHQISLIEKQRDKIISNLQNSLDVPIEIDWEKIKDDLVDLGQSGKIVIDDIVLDLDNATVVGDVSSDVGDITQDIVTDYKNIAELNKKIEEQNTIFEKQEEIRAKISDLETKGKTDTKEYIKLKKELETLDKAALEARKKIQESIEKEVEMLKDLRDEEKKIKEEIQERETVYKRQEELLKGQIDQVKKQIETTKNLYDDQIKAQKHKLDLLDEQIEREDRLIQRTKLLQELENVRNDKRHEIINKDGQVELTYDKGKVAELEQQLADFDKETQRNDERKQIEDEIKRLEELRDKQITQLESTIEVLESDLGRLKETHDREIAQLNFYLNQNKVLQDKLLSNINKHISDLEKSFNKEIQFQNSRLEQLKAIHEAEIQAYEAYISGLEVQLDRLNDDIGEKIDKLAKRLDENIEHFAESAWDLGLLARDIKKLAEQVSNIDISSPSKGSGRLREKHVGGIVGEKTPSKATQLANKIFNAKPNETVIKSLIGELQIPPKNIAQNFIPAMQNFANQVSSMVSGRNTTPAVVSQDTHYNFGDVTVKADNPMQLFRGLDNIINARKK